MDTWATVKNEILRIWKFKNNVNDWKILNLMFPKSRLDNELIWLVSSYVWYVWDSVHVRGADVRAEQFFGVPEFQVQGTSDEIFYTIGKFTIVELG